MKQDFSAVEFVRLLQEVEADGMAKIFSESSGSVYWKFFINTTSPLGPIAADEILKMTIEELEAAYAMWMIERE